jgi:heme-degrading monooxygenase HmoA
VVPRHAEAAFLAAWRQREQDMQHFGGFQGFNIIHDGEVYTVSSRWAQKDSVLMSIGW